MPLTGPGSLSYEAEKQMRSGPVTGAYGRGSYGARGKGIVAALVDVSRGSAQGVLDLQSLDIYSFDIRLRMGVTGIGTDNHFSYELDADVLGIGIPASKVVIGLTTGVGRSGVGGGELPGAVFLDARPFIAWISPIAGSIWARAYFVDGQKGADRQNGSPHVYVPAADELEIAAYFCIVPIGWRRDGGVGLGAFYREQMREWTLGMSFGYVGGWK